MLEAKKDAFERGSLEAVGVKIDLHFGAGSACSGYTCSMQEPQLLLCDQHVLGGECHLIIGFFALQFLRTKCQAVFGADLHIKLQFMWQLDAAGVAHRAYAHFVMDFPDHLHVDQSVMTVH